MVDYQEQNWLVLPKDLGTTIDDCENVQRSLPEEKGASPKVNLINRIVDHELNEERQACRNRVQWYGLDEHNDSLKALSKLPPSLLVAYPACIRCHFQLTWTTPLLAVTIVFERKQERQVLGRARTTCVAKIARVCPTTVPRYAVDDTVVAHTLHRSACRQFAKGLK